MHWNYNDKQDLLDVFSQQVLGEDTLTTKALYIRVQSKFNEMRKQYENERVNEPIN